MTLDNKDLFTFPKELSVKSGFHLSVQIHVTNAFSSPGTVVNFRALGVIGSC